MDSSLVNHFIINFSNGDGFKNGLKILGQQGNFYFYIAGRTCFVCNLHSKIHRTLIISEFELQSCKSSQMDWFRMDDYFLRDFCGICLYNLQHFVSYYHSFQILDLIQRKKKFKEKWNDWFIGWGSLRRIINRISLSCGFLI